MNIINPIKIFTPEIKQKTVAPTALHQQPDIFFSARKSSYPKPSSMDRIKLTRLTGMEWPSKTEPHFISHRSDLKHPRSKIINKAIGMALGLIKQNESGNTMQMALTQLLNDAEADDIEKLLGNPIQLNGNETLSEYEALVADALKIKVYKYGLPNVLNLKTTEDYYWFLKTANLQEGLTLVENDLRLLIAGYPAKDSLSKLKSGQW